MELIKNVKTAVTPGKVAGIPCFNDEEKDLYLHTDAPGDSFFVVANVEGEDGNTYNFLIHNGAMIPSEDDSFQVMVAMVSLTDKANKEYIHEERTFPFKECTFSRERLEIISPVTTLTGDSQEMEVAGKLPDSRGEIHAVLKNCGPALNNCGNGMFQCFNNLVSFHHYGLPYLKAEGTLKFDGKEIRFTGDAWLDRQWGSHNLPLVMAENKIQTKWMDLNLSNGYKVSLWDIQVDGGIENSFATILSPKGTVTLAEMTPLIEYEEDYWYSEKTGNYYATRYIVEMPDINTEIHVQVYEGIPHQEAVSATGYNRYEAHSTCEGIFMGEHVDGFCCVELVGHFEKAGTEAKQEERKALGPKEFDASIGGIYKGIVNSPMGEKEITFDYAVSDGKLSGSIEVMGKTSIVTDAESTAEGFTHHFKMKLPVGSVDVTANCKVEAGILTAELKTPMGKLEVTAEKQAG